MNEIKLHDIKNIVDVHEYSIYYFIGSIILGLLITIFILYLAYIWYKKINAFSIKKEHLKLLNSLSLSDAKKSAYDITLYGSSFKNDSLQHTKAYDDLVDKLQEYKYKKDVKEFDAKTLEAIKLYVEICHV